MNECAAWPSSPQVDAAMFCAHRHVGDRLRRADGEPCLARAPDKSGFNSARGSGEVRSMLSRKVIRLSILAMIHTCVIFVVAYNP